MRYCDQPACHNEANSFTVRHRTMSEPKLTFYCTGHEDKAIGMLVTPKNLVQDDKYYYLAGALGMLGKKVVMHRRGK